MQIGGLCRVMTIQDVARLMYLHWHAVRDLDKIYMREQLRVAGDPKPRIIGIDEISIKKGHSYRIVVSDLVARRAIWFGGTGRTEADMDLFYAFLGKQNSRKIRLAVMDMWKPFRVSTQRHAPKAVIMFDKFHIVKLIFYSSNLQHIDATAKTASENRLGTTFSVTDGVGRDQVSAICRTVGGRATPAARRARLAVGRGGVRNRKRLPSCSTSVSVNESRSARMSGQEPSWRSVAMRSSNSFFKTKARKLHDTWPRMVSSSL